MVPVYGMEPETDTLPALTEEELQNLLTGEELVECVVPRMKKFFG